MARFFKQVDSDWQEQYNNFLRNADLDVSICNRYHQGVFEQGGLPRDSETDASFLMGNAIAMVDESCWNDDLKTLNTHIRKISTYVINNHRDELGP